MNNNLGKLDYLIIDGNYFAQRVLGQLNQGDKTNNLVMREEQEEFKIALKRSLLNLYKTFNNDKISLIDYVIFCTDNGSWRKQIEPFKPYWFDTIFREEQPPLEYKGQRKSKKDESPIDYEQFYDLYREFVNELKHLEHTNLNVFDIPLCEGDDLISMLRTEFNKQPNAFGIVFCTDGDLEQVVSDNFVLFRNIRSGSCPNGEIVMNSTRYDILNPKDIMLHNGVQTYYMNDLCSVHIGDVDRAQPVRRELNEGVRIAKPYSIIAKKSFCGDAKDNIFSPISWLSSTGTRKYGISEKIFISACNELGLIPTEAQCQELLQNVQFRKRLVEQLVIKSKQQLTEEQIQIVFENVNHNIKMNMLSTSTIPADLYLQFKTEFDSIDFTNFKTELDKCSLFDVQDTTTSILADSIEEDMLKELLG